MSQKRYGVENCNNLQMAQYINVIFWDMVPTTYIKMFTKFQFNISKATSVMTMKRMMGQNGLGW